MVNDMRYYKFDNGIVISAYNEVFAKGIYNQVCFNEFEDDDIEEVSKYEALGLFVEALSTNEADMDSVAIQWMFSDTRNEILCFG